MGPTNRALPAVLAIVGFGAAVALVGAGSVAPDRHGGSAAADTVLIALAVLVGLTALGFAAYVARRTRRPPSSSEGTEGSGVPAFLLRPLLTPLVATLLLLLFSVLVLGPCLNKDQTDPDGPPSTRPATTAAPSGAQARAAHDRPDWSVVAGLVCGAAGLALAVMTARSRRRPAVEQEGPTLDDEIAASLADLDALDSDPDHRRVVIRSYARMELAFGRRGSPRQPSETPHEYLRRAMSDLGVGAASAGELTALFEQARFSTHAVDAAMRARASAALRAVRSEIGRGAMHPG